MYVIQEFSCITFARQDISYVTEFWKGFSLRTRSFVLFFPLRFYIALNSIQNKIIIKNVSKLPNKTKY